MEKNGSPGITRRSFLSGMAAAGGVLGVASLGVGALGIAGCSGKGSGTASATVPGFGGDVTVTLTMEDGTITACKAMGTYETADRGGRAIASMPSAIVKANSVDVDVVAGATVTSNTIKSAAEMAYNEIMQTSKPKENGQSLMAPGQYTASAIGGLFGILALPVTITVDEYALLDIQVPDDRFKHGETEVILNSVKETLFDRMIASQSVKVDAIAGATATSNAIKAAAEEALKKAIVAAGNDESEISRFYKVPKDKKVVVEEKETDILFVGLGMANVLAMRRAVDAMREKNGGRPVSVLGIEKAGKIGGKSAMTHSLGVVNPPKYADLINGGKPFVDGGLREAWRKYTTDASGNQTAKDDLVDLYFAKSGEALDWLYFEHGWRFGTPKVSFAYLGILEFNYILTPGVNPGTMEDRRLAVDKLLRGVLQESVAQGAEILLETEGYELIVENGVCKGVKARSKVMGKEYVIKAKAVVMNTGGFALNQKLMKTLPDPKFAGLYERQVGFGMDDGLMFEAALNAGAGTWNAEMPPLIMQAGLPHRLTQYPIERKEGFLQSLSGREATWTLNDVPYALGVSADALDVDREGKRFANEVAIINWAGDAQSRGWQTYGSGPYYYSIWSKPQLDEVAKIGLTRVAKFQRYCAQGELPEGPMPKVFEILDHAIAEGMAWKGDTLEALAKQINLDPTTLKATYDTYNSYVESGVDEEFGKNKKYLLKIGEGPYYAIKICSAPYASGGGLDIDTQLRVLKSDHVTPIQGLYALGCDSLGVLMNRTKNYASFGGTAQGWSLTTGYVAGRNAAEYVAATYGLTEVSEALDPTKAL